MFGKCTCAQCTAYHNGTYAKPAQWRDPLDQPEAIVWSLDSEGVITVRIGKRNFTAPPWIAEVIRERTGYDK